MEIFFQCVCGGGGEGVAGAVSKPTNKFKSDYFHGLQYRNILLVLTSFRNFESEIEKNFVFSTVSHYNTWLASKNCHK